MEFSAATPMIVTDKTEKEVTVIMNVDHLMNSLTVHEGKTLELVSR